MITQRTLLSGDVGANVSLACDPDGTVLLSAWCGRLDVWRLDRMARVQSMAFPLRADDGEIIHRLLPPFAPNGSEPEWPDDTLPIAAVVVSENGGRIAMAAGSRVHLFERNPTTGEVKRTKKFGADGSMLTSLALSSDGVFAAATTADENVFVWNLERRTQVLRVEIASAGRACAFHEDWGQELRVLVGEVSGTVRAFALDAVEPVLVLPAQAAPVEHLVALPGGRFVSAGPDGVAHVWNLESPLEPVVSVRHSERISDCATVMAGSILLTVGFDGMLGMWSTTTGDLLGWYRETAPFYLVCALPDQQSLLTATGSSIHLLDLGDALTAGSSRPVQMPRELSLDRGRDVTPKTAVGLPLPRSTSTATPLPPRPLAQETPRRQEVSSVAIDAAALLAEELDGLGSGSLPLVPPGASGGTSTRVRSRHRSAERSPPATDLGFDEDEFGPIPQPPRTPHPVATSAGTGALLPNEELLPVAELPSEAGSGLIRTHAPDFDSAFTIQASNYTPAPARAVSDALVRAESASRDLADELVASDGAPAQLLRPKDLAIMGGAAIVGAALGFATITLGGFASGVGEQIGAALGAGLALFGATGLVLVKRRLGGGSATTQR